MVLEYYNPFNVNWFISLTKISASGFELTKSTSTPSFCRYVSVVGPMEATLKDLSKSGCSFKYLTIGKVPCGEKNTIQGLLLVLLSVGFELS
ncbi:hypothetical protein WICPIJ_006945 [Wickerhamomyces pijperi]|uniref:Uncharacterized protein n=1 Tax=Wickerhamomyces pijperi TaxID=599730 RepID=A0A9P8TKE6_WICPI|nr:hypothetical protein WICPIJ_006945 [Wickerhamomyces pijperi]